MRRDEAVQVMRELADKYKGQEESKTHVQSRFDRR